MRVLHINCNYLTTELHQTMVNHLNDLDVENVVFAPTYDISLSVVEPNSNVIVKKCFKKWDRLFFDYKQRKIRNGLLDSVDIESFDCIHAYTLFTDGNCAMHISRKLGIPYVVAVRNTDVNTFLKYMLYLRHRGVEILLNAKAVFFLSPAYKRTVLENYVPKKYQDEIEKKSLIMPNGIDDFWHNNVYDRLQNELCNKINLVYVGKIDKNKNIDTTQRAMELLSLKGFEVSLTVVGKVMDDSVLEKISTDKKTVILAPKPKEELISVYRANDIFVMPSHTETFGLVYVEAMTQGLPVIYTKGQGFDGHFKDGQVGFSVDDRKPQDIADAIEKIVTNYSGISRNLISASRSFCWDEICRKYKTIYENLL